MYQPEQILLRGQTVAEVVASKKKGLETAKRLAKESAHAEKYWTNVARRLEKELERLAELPLTYRRT